jgi:hypothetical protein
MISAIRGQLPAASDIANSALLAWQLGAQQPSLSAAFLLGYQLACRYVDPKLAAGELGAFCVSEKGMTSLRAMSCQLEGNVLFGSKSHVMLMQPRQLDWLYVLARQQQQLLLLKVAADAPGINASAPKPQPMVPEVQHSTVEFQQVQVEADFMQADAHERFNKPFRYWEDVHVGLTFAGWLSTHLEQADDALAPAANGLIQHFAGHADGYDATGLQATEALLAAMTEAAKGLKDQAAQQWQRDATLLQLAAKTRQRLRQKLLQHG